jgi:hypothetical protein
MMQLKEGNVCARYIILLIDCPATFPVGDPTKCEAQVCFMNTLLVWCLVEHMDVCTTVVHGRLHCIVCHNAITPMDITTLTWFCLFQLLARRPRYSIPRTVYVSLSGLRDMVAFRCFNPVNRVERMPIVCRFWFRIASRSLRYISSLRLFRR